MARRKGNKKRGPKAKKILSRPRQSPFGSSIINYLSAARSVIGGLPIDSAYKTYFNIFFNIISFLNGATREYRGAYAMFTIDAACMLKDSPLAANIKSTKQISFPAYSVKMKWLNIHLVNTTANSERSGRWAAVFFPYRELHDSRKFSTLLKDLTFQEVSSLPYSRVASCRDSIGINFRMRDPTMYCAQPREITEDLGVVFVIWDGNNDSPTALPPSSAFNCELELKAGMKPLMLFGPNRRQEYKEIEFDMHCITDGSKVRVHLPCGNIVYEPLSEHLNDDNTTEPFSMLSMDENSH